MHVSFIDDFTIWKNNKIEVDLITLVDDIKLEDDFEVNFDGSQVQDLDDLFEESNLSLPFHFQQTFSGLIIGNDIGTYLQIPNNWYKRSTK